MPDVVDVVIRNGSVQFIKPRPAEPASEHTEGNVTVRTSAVEGAPAHYEVSFGIDVACEDGGVQMVTFCNWRTIVLNADDRAPYREVEDQAARHIAPMLRAAADRIEAQIDETAKREGYDPQS